jgi:hypothetical protein
MFSSSFSEDSFYNTLFISFCAEHGVNLSDCDVVLTGFLESPQLNIPVTLTKSLYEVFSGVNNYYPILINNTSIFTSDFCLSTTALKQFHKQIAFADADEDNYYANLAMYPQIISNDISTQIDLDSNVSSLVDAKSIIPATAPLVFCGSRFSHVSLFPELDYMLMLSVIRAAGIYEIKKDPKNALILSTLLSIHEPKAVIPINFSFTHEATVIVSPDSIECMIHDAAGKSQLIQLEKGKTLVVAIPEGEKVKLMVKSRHLGTVERTVIGGGVGLIFDTRVDKYIQSQHIGTFSQSLKSFGSVVA